MSEAMIIQLVVVWYLLAIFAVRWMAKGCPPTDGEAMVAVFLSWLLSPIVLPIVGIVAGAYWFTQKVLVCQRTTN